MYPNEEDDIHEEIKNGYCEGCKGQMFMSESGCYETCEGYQKEYQEIKAEWEIELQTKAQELTEPEDG